ncbi:hypothetical protein GOBAR_AA04909 [Gossypium barbadense]|uniref:Uncharacterized protein n=1 Tax=Gossypium barbadense TaxID=3634 RepID=A0A2P5YJA2_GOSBA|nr:hypothetical protein GOBAR_AA04909 [Gossypium barbadense]
MVQCSWGSKPTAPGTSSAPLPPPAAAHMPGFSAADLAAYERHMAMSKYGGAQVMSMMHPQGQAIYDGGYQNVATTQQLMYYQ